MPAPLLLINAVGLTPRLLPHAPRLRALAEAESGAQGVELFEGDRSTPEAVAMSIDAMTFALGRRFIVADGVERWKDKDLDRLEAALAEIPPDTTVAFFAREDTRSKAPERLHRAGAAPDLRPARADPRL